MFVVLALLSAIAAQSLKTPFVAPVVDVKSTPLMGDAAPSTSYTPVVLMHGLGDAGDNPGMQSLVQSVQAAYPGVYAIAPDIADGIWSFITKMQDQVDQFAAQVQSDPKLQNGFDLVGLSQGGLIARAYVQQYNNPPVRNLVTICGVMNGEFSCPAEIDWIPFVCSIFEDNPYHFLFNGSFPLSFSDYWVEVDNRTMYMTENTFLPPLNNEVTPNATYKTNFESLAHLRLVQATEDTVVYPYQSEQFGGYIWNRPKDVYLYNESANYQQNTFGLKTLVEANKVSFAEFKGDHLRFNDSFWNTEILPYLAK